MSGRNNDPKAIEESSGGDGGENPLVSIVVPVYNVERYVKQCVDSLLAQTLGNIEIILVNDGSTDGSLKLLEAAVQRDVRVRLIDKPNGGYGAAVNRGFSEARGRYVAVAEPDDFVNPHMYEDLLGAARLPEGGWADVVKGSYWNYYDLPGQKPYVEAPNLMNCMPKKGFCSTAFGQFEVLFHHPSIWSAIYRRDFLEERGIRMIEPRGAGWADNPFFFETLLQAKSFVWVPAAYYYYRQTNPNASSNLRDYHLPFDRLRDIRELFERLGVTDRQVTACLYSRTFSYIGTVIGESGFPENDPELKALIREALDVMDPSILYGGYRGIRDEHIEYYELVTGTLSQRVDAHEKVKDPAASVVVPLRNDRAVLSATLSALVNQSLEDIEIVCVDCGSHDAGVALVEAYASRDRRIRVLRMPGAGVHEGMSVGVSAADAPVVAIVRPGERSARGHLAALVAALSNGAEMAVCGALATVKPVRPEAAAPGVIEAEGLRAEIACAPGFSLASCAFKANILAQALHDTRARSADGLAVATLALCRARRVGLADVPAPSRLPRNAGFGRLPEKGDKAAYQAQVAALDAAEDVLSGLGSDAQRTLACVAVRRLVEEVRTFAGSRDGREIFDDIVLRAHERYGIAAAPRSSFCNAADLNALELLLCSTYEDMLVREAARLRGSALALSKRVEETRASSSYRLGNAVVRRVRRLVPGSLRRRLGA